MVGFFFIKCCMHVHIDIAYDLIKKKVTYSNLLVVDEISSLNPYLSVSFHLPKVQFHV